MSEISDLVIEGSGQQFKGNDFRDLLNPGVYVCLKNERPIYVGMGNRLLLSISRFAGVKQNLIAFLKAPVIERLKPTNNVHFKYKKAVDILGVERPSRYAPCETAQSL